MAALSAARSNPALKALYERLCAAGKLSKVARCAVARKLLLQAYAVVRTGQPFDRQRAVQGQSAA
jgi:transposase